MNTCETCYWWKGYGTDHLIRQEYHNCGQCKNPRLTTAYPYSDGLSSGELIGCECEPITGADFGCIHWEAKQ
jgi:hypothetical protein